MNCLEDVLKNGTMGRSTAVLGVMNIVSGLEY